MERKELLEVNMEFAESSIELLERKEELKISKDMPANMQAKLRELTKHDDKIADWTFIDTFRILRGLPRPRDWNEEKLNSQANGVNFPLSMKEKPVMKLIITRFFDYYFTGALPQGASASQVVLPIIATLQVQTSEGSHEYFFPPSDFAVESFLSGAIPAGPDDISSKEGDSQVAWSPPIRGTHIHRATNALYDTYEVKKFQNAVRAVIMDWDTRAAFTQEVFKLLSLSGFLALTLMCGLTKDAGLLSRIFKEDQYKKNVFNLTMWPANYSFAPPCQKCIAECAIELDRRHVASLKTFAVLLRRWRDYQTSDYCSPYIIEYIYHGLLIHTAGHAMETVVLLFVAREILGIDINEMLEYTLKIQTKLIWKYLVKFIKTYLPRRFDCVENTRPKSTAFWARIFSDGYFTELATRHHPSFCGIMGAIMSAHQATGSIKEAVWFKNNVVLAENGFKYGESLVSILTSKMDPSSERTKKPGPWMELYEVQKKKSGRELWIKNSTP